MIRPIRDQADLHRRLAILGKRLARVDSRKARLEAIVAKLKSLISRDNDHNAKDLAAILVYCRAQVEAHPEHTIPVGPGFASLYTAKQGKLCFVDDEAATIAELREQLPREKWETFIRTLESVRKTALKDNPEILDTLNTAYAERGEFFSVAPGNTSHKLSLPVSVLEGLAIDAGLLPEPEVQQSA